MKNRSSVSALVVLLICAAAHAADKEVLIYRLVEKKTVHIHEPQKAKDYEAALKSLNVDVELSAHGGHHDVTFSCPQWKSKEFGSHEACTKWETWLKKLGFEARHEHQ